MSIVEIKEPCPARWNEMLPAEDGRHCLSCNKTVVDFRSHSTEEILAYFREHSGRKICGIFRKEKVKTPRRKFHFQLLRFAAACWLGFGTMLFSSCGEKENQHVVGDSAIITPVMDSVHRADSIHAAQQRDSAKTSGGENQNHDSLTVTKSSSVQVDFNGGRRHPPALPVAPRYTDGNAALQKFLDSNLKYPADAQKNNIKGIVAVDFLVKADGSIANVKVRQGLGHGCDEEAVRLVRLMPKWTPGKKDGQVVDMEYNLAIEFGK